MTLSVPLMIKVPLSVISGISPKYTSCSLTARISLVFVMESIFQTTSLMVTFIGAAKVRPLKRHSSSEFFGSPISYLTNSRDVVSCESLMGNTLLKTACKPMFSLFSGAISLWRKLIYESSWISMRLGISRISLILP